MSDASESIAEQIGDALRKFISAHGHAFQYAVLRRGELLAHHSQSRWQLEFSELPAEVRGHSTRIDFVLRQRHWSGYGPARYMVGECKRANPALANWCFVRAPYTTRDPYDIAPVDAVQRDGDTVSAATMQIAHGQPVYAVAYEIRTNDPGSGTTSRGVIEEAAGQVMRGVNGLVELFARAPDLLQDGSVTALLPAIFTTARLWVTDADVAAAAIDTGELPAGSVAVKEVPWLWFRYHPAPGITHTLPHPATVGELSKLADLWYMRTIAIVSPAGIDEFLQREWS